MEKINVLARIVFVAALSVVIGTWTPYFAKHEGAAGTYEELQSGFAQIMQEMELQDQEITLISEAEFQKGITDEELQARVSALFTKSTYLKVMKEETKQEVIKQVLSFYHNQKELMVDHVQEDYVYQVRVTGCTLLVISGAIMGWIRYKKRANKRNEKMKHTAQENDLISATAPQHKNHPIG